MTALCTYFQFSIFIFLGYDTRTSSYEYVVFKALHTRAQVGRVVVYPTLSKSER